MKQSDKQLKRHVISLRISAMEWDSLHDTMADLQFKRVSDLLREAFKLVHAQPASFVSTARDRELRVGSPEQRHL